MLCSDTKRKCHKEKNRTIYGQCPFTRNAHDCITEYKQRHNSNKPTNDVTVDKLHGKSNNQLNFCPSRKIVIFFVFYFSKEKKKKKIKPKNSTNWVTFLLLILQVSTGRTRKKYNAN